MSCRSRATRKNNGSVNDALTERDGKRDRFDTALGNCRQTTYLHAMANTPHSPLPFETVSLGPEGEIRLPTRLRHLLGWQEGDKLVLTADDRGFVNVLTVRDAVRGVRGTLSTQASALLLADELIEERRREAESSWR
jgi:bifunctional DNA-binding transcriptional regulator/antitoxin component of YhaV-PrlF toxin-antitoxin module